MEQLQQLASKAVEQGIIIASALQPTTRHEVDDISSHQLMPAPHNNDMHSPCATTESESGNETARQTCPMTRDTRPALKVQEQGLPRVTQDVITSSKRQAKKRRVKMRVAAGATAPASNTGSKIAARAATARRSTRPSRLVQPTRTSKTKSNSGTANAVKVRRDNRRLR